MKRHEKRQLQRKFKKPSEEIENLSSDAIKIIETYCKQEAEQKIEIYKKLVDDAVFDAMRMNRISVERANRVICAANTLILENVQRGAQNENI